MADHPRPRVLVVDDDDLLREALCEMLANRGFQVVGQAGSAQQAVALAARVRPDVVIMDFRLPGTDGVEAIHRIRSANPSIRAVVFTGYDDQALIDDATRAGASGFIVKGSDPALILKALERVGGGGLDMEAHVQE